ncbi:unnamed protein product [Nyctereutes procyonoides]|uniref:(raccoon dog) hypothetical protein n=1 Tax=Nyctereutes procyonoides TaxID=34880 RepID=A0A811Y4S4_NYCPR|nr:unnamed protein product [Nyctereutes procyonoides]
MARNFLKMNTEYLNIILVCDMLATFYLFIHETHTHTERERERERERQREKRAPRREPDL